MRYAIDLETECTVPSCPDFGKSLCSNKHSLSPWHSRITVLAIVSETGAGHIFRGDSKSIAENAKQFLEKDASYELAGHNAKFDFLHLHRHGFSVPLERWTGDSQLGAYVLTEKIPDSWLAEYEANRIALGRTSHRKAGKHSLKTLAPFFLGVEPFWEPEHGHDDDEYVMKDARYTLSLVDAVEAKLKARGEFEFYKERQLEWTKMLLTAEMHGLEFDALKAAELERELKAKSAELKAKLDVVWAPAQKAYVEGLRARTFARYTDMARTARDKVLSTFKKRISTAKTQKAKEKAEALLEERISSTIERYEQLAQAAVAALPRELSFDSPTQMTWLLRDFHGYNITSLEGDETTGREILERLADEGHDDVKTYLEWRKANKILSAFLPTYKELAAPDGSGHLRLHPIFNPDSTRTGRTSSERPNCQQVPSALKSLFKARAGYKIVGYDAAAIEAKLIALYSEDSTLYEIVDSGTSIHDFNVVNFFELDEEYSVVKTKYPQHRKASKNVGFALFYNAGKNRIRIAFAQAGFIITEEQAARIHRVFKKRFKEAHAYGMEVVEFMEKGNVLFNLLGRPLAIEHAEDAYMKAFNKLIQSSASDLNLEGAYRAWKAFQKASIDATPILFVHDFVGFEIREDQVSEADAILQRELVGFDLTTKHGQIKLEIEGGVSDRWES